MAKSTLKTVSFSSLGWLYSLNTRQSGVDSVAQTKGESYGSALSDLRAGEKDGKAVEYTPQQNSEGLCVPLSDGWDTSQGLLYAVPLDDAAIMLAGAAETDSTMERFNGLTVDGLRELLSVERETMVKVWRESDEFRKLGEYMASYWDKNPPEYLALCGYRRSVGVCGAMLRTNAKDYKIPCELVKPASWLSALSMNIRENSQKTVGRRPYSPVDYCRIAGQVFAAGGTEAEFGRVAGLLRGSAQKFWAVSKLVARFPELDIQNRIALPSDNPRFLPVSKLEREPIVKLLDGFDPRQKEKTAVPVVDAEYAEEWLSEVSEGKPVLKSMNGRAIAEQKQTATLELVKEVLQAVLANDAGYFAHLRKVSVRPAVIAAHATLLAAIREPDRKPETKPEAKAEAEAKALPE